jgi:ABC-2 type transport system permease protein
VETRRGRFSLPRAVRLLWLFLRLGAQHELAYRGNLGAQALLSGTNLAALLAFVAVVYGRTESLAGWRPPELLALWGVFHVLTGLLGAVVQPSLQRLVEDIHRGTFDQTLTKPVDAQLLASIQQVQVWRLLDTALGVALLAVAVAALPVRVGPGQALAFVVALLAGGAMVYGCCLALATLAFWLVRIENVLLAFLTFWEAGRWPVGLYPQWLRIGLTFVVPVAFATTVPAPSPWPPPSSRCPAGAGTAACAGTRVRPLERRRRSPTGRAGHAPGTLPQAAGAFGSSRSRVASRGRRGMVGRLRQRSPAPTPGCAHLWGV